MSSTSTGGEHLKLSHLVVAQLKTYGYSNVSVRYGVFLNPITVSEIAPDSERPTIKELSQLAFDPASNSYRTVVLTAITVCVPVVWQQFSMPGATDEVHQIVAQHIASWVATKMRTACPLLVWSPSITVDKPFVRTTILATTPNGEQTTQVIEGPGAEFHVRVSGVLL